MATFSVSESLSLVDTSSWQLKSTLIASDLITFTDSIVLSNSTDYDKFVTDSITFTDLPLFSILSTFSVTNAITLADSVYNILILSYSVKAPSGGVQGVPGSQCVQYTFLVFNYTGNSEFVSLPFVCKNHTLSWKAIGASPSANAFTLQGAIVPNPSTEDFNAITASQAGTTNGTVSVSNTPLTAVMINMPTNNGILIVSYLGSN